MNNVTINRGQGGLGRQPLGQDFISGMVFYPTSATLGLSNCPITNGQKAKLGGISDALALGITPGHFGETTAQITLTLSSYVGGSSPDNLNAGDIIQVKYVDCQGNTVILCTYTVVSGDSSTTLLATHLADAINALSGQTGFSATESTNTVVITVMAGQGIFPNSGTPLTAAIINDNTVTLQYSQSVTRNGVASQLDAFYYHINRFFIQSPNSTLYVLFAEAPSSWTGYGFAEVTTLFNYANGAIRQMGIYQDSNVATAPTMANLKANVEAIQEQVAAIITTHNFGVSVLLGATLINPTGSVLAAAFTDLSICNSEHVSVVAGQDGGAEGNYLYNSYGISITQLGDVLGLVSRAQVSDDIAWVATYTLSPDGVENAFPALATGELLSNLSAGTINSVDAYRFIFGRQFVNDSPNGTFVNDSHCATAYTSDYAYIENNRTFDKAARQLYSAYVAQLAAPLVLNSDGTLTNSTVAFFEGLGEQALSNMAQTNPNTGRPELSGFSVTINPAQNVLQTSTLVVSVSLQPVGVAREIVINLQFAVSL